MSLKKTMVVAAAAGAIAATAVPAMALENEFHGLFRVRGIISNFDDSAGGAVQIGNETGSHRVDGKPYKNPPTYSYIEQRTRLMYIAKANDDLRLVTHFEIDSRWGDNSYDSNGPGGSLSSRNNGGGIGADQTNIETKNAFLEFKIPSTPVTVKAGIQGFTDNYKGIIFNNDAAGLTAVAKMGAVTINGAYFRFDDATTGNTYLNFPVSTGSTNATNPIANTVVGRNTRDFATLGARFSFSKALTVGGDYYLLYSDVLRGTQEKTTVHMVGANAEAKVGPLTVNGFGIYQFGRLGDAGFHTHQTVSAFAGNLAAKVAVGPGTAHVTALVISGDHDTSGTGDRNDFQTIMERSSTSSGHTFYESNSMLLLRHVQASNATDRAVVFDLNNNGRGIVTAFAGYDLLLGKVFWNSNVGMGAVEQDNRNPNNGIGSGHRSNVLGTEVNTEIGYKVYDNMTASVQGAYLFLGDFYKVGTGKVDNPYTTRLVLNYTF